MAASSRRAYSTRDNISVISPPGRANPRSRAARRVPEEAQQGRTRALQEGTLTMPRSRIPPCWTGLWGPKPRNQRQVVVMSAHTLRPERFSGSARAHGRSQEPACRAKLVSTNAP
eukprot:scaffold14960_cov67-Phaeocystis_antarctica.AAC.2